MAPTKEQFDLWALMLSAVFDPAALKELLARYAKNVSVERGDPIYPFWFVGRSLPFYGLKAFFRLGLLKPRFFSRIYAVASVREN